MGYLEVCKVEARLLENPHNRDLGDLGFSGVGRQSRVSGPCVGEKRDWLTCHCESYPGLHRGDENQGLEPWAPSAANLRRLGRARSENLCSGPGGDVQIPRGGLSS